MVKCFLFNSSSHGLSSGKRGAVALGTAQSRAGLVAVEPHQLARAVNEPERLPPLAAALGEQEVPHLLAAEQRHGLEVVEHGIPLMYLSRSRREYRTSRPILLNGGPERSRRISSRCFTDRPLYAEACAGSSHSGATARLSFSAIRSASILIAWSLIPEL